MGWQDRDWAKFDDEELRELYGVTPQPADPARAWIWSLVVVAVLAVGGFAYTQRPSNAVSPVGHELVALVGARGTDARASPFGPGGTDTVCTEEAYAQATGQWACLSWELNLRHLAVVTPPAYVGACTHLVADQTAERWTCLGAGVVPPDQLPVPAGDGST
jgi:hypothetical protein